MPNLAWTATNTGQDAARSVVIRDEFDPAAFEFLNASDASCAAAANPSHVACAIGDLGAGQTKTVTVTLRVRETCAYGQHARNTGEVEPGCAYRLV
jgi:hypothetical protein